MRSLAGKPPRSVLDAACGVGTQSLALAGLGYEVRASDLSAVAVARAARKANARGLTLYTSVADMREAFDHHRRAFAVVIACDNAVPHQHSDAEILRAFRQSTIARPRVDSASFQSATMMRCSEEACKSIRMGRETCTGLGMSSCRSGTGMANATTQLCTRSNTRKQGSPPPVPYARRTMR